MLWSIVGGLLGRSLPNLAHLHSRYTHSRQLHRPPQTTCNYTLPPHSYGPTKSSTATIAILHRYTDGIPYTNTNNICDYISTHTTRLGRKLHEYPLLSRQGEVVVGLDWCRTLILRAYIPTYIPIYTWATCIPIFRTVVLRVVKLIYYKAEHDIVTGYWRANHGQHQPSKN